MHDYIYAHLTPRIAFTEHTGLDWFHGLVCRLYCSSVFTALHGMQTRSCDENSVCGSIRLSVKRVHCDKTEEKSVAIFIPCERSFSLVF